MHSEEVLAPTEYQKKKYVIQKISDIFPKYYIIRVDNFKKQEVSNPVEEWLYFLRKVKSPPISKQKALISKEEIRISADVFP